ncbi:MAG TPA: hypothetical protein VGB17_16320 [Pyrinomonadaceae bacterium]|jgi:hypothetical protein
MSSNFLSGLLAPKFPATALGLEAGRATVVQLERKRREGFALKRAATIALPEELIRPSFDETNIADLNELADTLAELATGAGLLGQRRWSAALPEAAARTMILTMEGTPASRKEQDEILRWKTERSFGLPLEELRVTREGLSPDTQGRPRYIMTGVRLSVLEEYEAVFQSLGWRAGLILPRHLGEARWLMQGRTVGDALLVSTNVEGFTAIMLHNARPSIVRSVACAAEECANELYRLMLFYRDRVAAQGADAQSLPLERLLVISSDEGFGAERVREIVGETLGLSMNALRAEDVGLALPSADISFNALAAPAGLATLAWA